MFFSALELCGGALSTNIPPDNSGIGTEPCARQHRVPDSPELGFFAYPDHYGFPSFFQVPRRLFADRPFARGRGARFDLNLGWRRPGGKGGYVTRRERTRRSSRVSLSSPRGHSVGSRLSLVILAEKRPRPGDELRSVPRRAAAILCTHPRP